MPKKGIKLTTKASEKIKNYIKQNNISQEKFVEELKTNSKPKGFSSKTFGNWLNGKNSIDLEALDIIIDKLGIGAWRPH